MGIKNIFGGIKSKAQDMTMDKVLERMRDLKQPISDGKIKKLIATHVLTLPHVKSAKCSITRDGFDIKVSYDDSRDSTRRVLAFEQWIWTPQKRALVVTPDKPYDPTSDQGTYSCLVTALAAILREMLGMNEKTLKEDPFSTEIGPIAGVIEKEGKHYYEFRRIPLLKQYVNYRLQGQCPIDHLNVVDAWCENGKFIVRIDNNKIVDQIKNMDLDPAQLRQMMKGTLNATEE